MRQLLQLLSDVDGIEDFIKLGAFDGKIDKQAATEILRLISEAKTRALE